MTAGSKDRQHSTQLRRVRTKPGLMASKKRSEKTARVPIWHHRRIIIMISCNVKPKTAIQQHQNLNAQSQFKRCFGFVTRRHGLPSSVHGGHPYRHHTEQFERELHVQLQDLQLRKTISRYQRIEKELKNKGWRSKLE